MSNPAPTIEVFVWLSLIFADVFAWVAGLVFTIAFFVLLARLSRDMFIRS